MDVRIYMAGGMSGYTLEEQLKWRNQVKDALLYGDYDIIKSQYFLAHQNIILQQQQNINLKEKLWSLNWHGLEKQI